MASSGSLAEWTMCLTCRVTAWARRRWRTRSRSIRSAPRLQSLGVPLLCPCPSIRLQLQLDALRSRLLQSARDQKQHAFMPCSGSNLRRAKASSCAKVSMGNARCNGSDTGSAARRIPHKVKGESIYAYITLTDEGNAKGATDETKKSLVAHVRKQIGAFAAPDTIHWAPGLPKTRREACRGFLSLSPSPPCQAPAAPALPPTRAGAGTCFGPHRITADNGAGADVCLCVCRQVRQDHAEAAAEDCGGRRQARRHVHSGRPVCRGRPDRAAGQVSTRQPPVSHQELQPNLLGASATIVNRVCGHQASLAEHCNPAPCSSAAASVAWSEHKF